MGIKFFYNSWFKKKFHRDIFPLVTGQTFEDFRSHPDTKEEECIYDPEIDNLMIDMNGLFHNSAQKIYEYGNYKPRQRFLSKQKENKSNSLQKQIAVFKDICENVQRVLTVVKPRKRLVLCVDGNAPQAKQQQQRMRRFVSALTRKEDDDSFDSNCISPGTKFMDHLCKYIDWYIRKKLSEEDPLWKNLEVVYSNASAPQEGEHKLLNFIRKFGNSSESFCLHGMDADLIMLALGTHLPKFWILREDPMDYNYAFYAINVGKIHDEIGECLKWEGKTFNFNRAIDDFIFMCFSVGNDFLPHIPCIEIIERGIEIMIGIYKKVGAGYGHLTMKTPGDVPQAKFRRRAVSVFLGTMAQYEKEVLENKMKHKESFFRDIILERNCKREEDTKKEYRLDIEAYRQDYYNTNLPEVKDEEKLCHEYLEGMNWVLNYYTIGVSNWNWKFTHHYAPFAHTLAKHAKSFSFPDYPTTVPNVPFVQLLSILPPKSANLLPSPLDTLLASEQSPLASFCPRDFPLDLAGKRQEWEAVVLLPIVDSQKIEKEYYKLIRKVDEVDRKRNVLGKSFIYYKVKKYTFNSFYGDFVCRVSAKAIDL